MAEVTKEALQTLVKTLCMRSAEDIEKLLLHILDTARNRWVRKANEALRQLKDKDMDEEALVGLRENYKHAFEQAHRLSRMRYGIAKPKRPLGGPVSVPATIKKEA
jgi:hypothetical protein